MYACMLFYLRAFNDSDFSYSRCHALLDPVSDRPISPPSPAIVHPFIAGDAVATTTMTTTTMMASQLAPRSLWSMDRTSQSWASQRRRHNNQGAAASAAAMTTKKKNAMLTTIAARRMQRRSDRDTATAALSRKEVRRWIACSEVHVYGIRTLGMLSLPLGATHSLYTSVGCLPWL